MNREKQRYRDRSEGTLLLINHFAKHAHPLIHVSKKNSDAAETFDEVKIETKSNLGEGGRGGEGRTTKKVAGLGLGGGVEEKGERKRGRRVGREVEGVGRGGSRSKLGKEDRRGGV